jgi:hypothetical protein
LQSFPAQFVQESRDFLVSDTAWQQRKSTSCRPRGGEFWTVSLLQLFTYHFPNRQDGEKTIPAGKNQTRLSLTTPRRSSILHFIDKKIGRTSAENHHLPESSIYGPPEN